MKRLSTTDPASPTAFQALVADGRDTTSRVDAPVTAIIADIRARGDAALIDYTSRFDRLDLTPATLRVTPAEIDAAVAAIPAPSALPSTSPPPASKPSTAPNCPQTSNRRTTPASTSACAGPRSTPSASTSPAAKRPTPPPC